MPSSQAAVTLSWLNTGSIYLIQWGAINRLTATDKLT